MHRRAQLVRLSLAALLGAAAGATTAKTVVNLMSGGTPTRAMTIAPNQTFFPIGTQSLPGIAFGGGSIANESGMYMTAATGTPNLNISLGGATVGFIDLPTSAGTPTGVPADVRTGKVSCEVDTTNLKICCFFSGEWK
jgi:hypothetical protein